MDELPLNREHHSSKWVTCFLEVFTFTEVKSVDEQFVSNSLCFGIE